MNSENMFILRSTLLFNKLKMYHNAVHWLDVSERIQFMLCVNVYKCLHGIAPKNYVQSLHSTAKGQIDVPHPKTSTYGRRAFSFASPSAWNSLPNYLKDSSLTLDMFKRSLEIFCIQVLAHRVHWRCLLVSALYKFTFTFAFTLHYGQNGCVLQRLIRLVLVLIGLFKSIKQ